MIEFCAIKDCGRRAGARPTIVVWESPAKKWAPTVIAFKSLGLCDGCVKAGKFETVYLADPQFKAEASLAVIQKSGPPPDWSTVSVRWHPIQGNDAPEFSSGAEGYQPI